MRGFLSWCVRFLKSLGRDAWGAEVGRQKRRFRCRLVLMMTGVAMTPLLLVVLLSMQEYSRLLEKEAETRMRGDAMTGKLRIETFLEELQLALFFFAREHTIDALSDRGTLNSLYQDLKGRFDGVMGLGVVNPSGVLETYAGPFDLAGRDFSQEAWFKKAVTRHSHVSTVHTGDQPYPHFHVSVTTKSLDSGDYRILAASVDLEVIERFLSSIGADTSYHDVFIVDSAGRRQAPARSAGSGETYPIYTRPDVSAITLTRREDASPALWQAAARIKGAPWILVLVQEGFGAGLEGAWRQFRDKILVIAAGCATLILIVIVRTVNLFIDQMYRAYESRDAAIAEAEHAAKLASIGHLAAGVAHEINNPLAIIDQKAGLSRDLLEISSDFENKEKVDAQIKGVQEAVKRCKVITYRLLGFARRMDVSPEEIDINALLQEVLSFLEKEALYKHIAIESSFASGLPRILSDRGKLQQIFLNVVNNAIDAVSPQGEGRIEISSARKDENTVRVAVSDNGPGIPRHMLKHIFSPFFTTKEPGKGTGLGLSITYGLVKKLGGAISVETAVGKGTTFFVDLPVGGGMRPGGGGTA